MPEMKKHIKDDSIFAVNVTERAGFVGPLNCPQPGWQDGHVHYLIYGGHSGDYMTETPCKCCDGKGQLLDGEPAYRTYCCSNGVRDLSTGYPNPIPMSSSVYNDKNLSERVQQCAAARANLKIR